jgi:hypothetical protein
MGRNDEKTTILSYENRKKHQLIKIHQSKTFSSEIFSAKKFFIYLYYNTTK